MSAAGVALLCILIAAAVALIVWGVWWLTEWLPEDERRAKTEADRAAADRS